jgi:hypothetical protein
MGEEDQKNVGRKDDAGKPRYDLIPPKALAGIVDALTDGANRYGDENWRMVLEKPGGPSRYFAAVLRHLFAWKRGELVDARSGLHPLAHAGASLMFLMEAPDAADAPIAYDLTEPAKPAESPKPTNGVAGLPTVPSTWVTNPAQSASWGVIVLTTPEYQELRRKVEQLSVENAALKEQLEDRQPIVYPKMEIR